MRQERMSHRQRGAQRAMGHREPQRSSAHFAIDNSDDPDERKITYDKTSMSSFSPTTVRSRSRGS